MAEGARACGSIRGAHARLARGMWERGPSPGKLQPWISEGELEYVIGEFEENGWNGGLNWYRVMGINYHATPQLAG